MHKYLTQVANYLPWKVGAGLLVSVFSDTFFKLLLLLVCLNLFDIFTRWLAQSYHCHKALYPQTPCGLWRSLCFMWQARRWRFIVSTGLRDGFCDKFLLYLLLLLLGAIVDTAYALTNAPKVLSSVIVVVLSTTEALSVLENISEVNEIARKIKEKFQKR